MVEGIHNGKYIQWKVCIIKGTPSGWYTHNEGYTWWRINTVEGIYVKGSIRWRVYTIKSTYSKRYI